MTEPRASRRWLWLALGWLSLGLAVAGALLPLLPTTVFLISAAACFGRAAPQWEARLLAHPRFGPTLRDWREHGAIAPRAKAMACAGIALGLALFCWQFKPSWLLGTAVALPMLGCALYLLSRPRPAGASSSAPPPRAVDPQRWGLGASLLAHGLALLLLFQQFLLPSATAEPPEARPVLLQARLLPAAAPPQPLEAKTAPEPSRAAPARPVPPRPAEPTPPEPRPPAPEAAPPLLPAPEAPNATWLAAAPAPAAPTRSEASVAAAPPAPALPPAAQAGGLSSDSWQARVLARLERFRSYPAGARARREQGVAYVLLRLDREGRVLSARLQRGSGHGELDQAALATIRRAQPLPAIPAELPAELELLVPVEFFLSR
ncbi:TonB family protein [Roseateles sp. DAIF2]|uniref:TonB family protein n=1 Tax=Roseateles sp. DAIF2 TaxID=2714952 RepID=UPI0018A2D30A|nr:TonB family protein [Roseateles sp. DAIF2]QPF75405.1 TonB family protein [Roseateles sp. DAIF2]